MKKLKIKIKNFIQLVKLFIRLSKDNRSLNNCVFLEMVDNLFQQINNTCIEKSPFISKLIMNIKDKDNKDKEICRISFWTTVSDSDSQKDDPLYKIDQLIAEREGLKIENAYLKQMLNSKYGG